MADASVQTTFVCAFPELFSNCGSIRREFALVSTPLHFLINSPSPFHHLSVREAREALRGRARKARNILINVPCKAKRTRRARNRIPQFSGETPAKLYFSIVTNRVLWFLRCLAEADFRDASGEYRKDTSRTFPKRVSRYLPSRGALGTALGNDNNRNSPGCNFGKIDSRQIYAGSFDMK